MRIKANFIKNNPKQAKKELNYIKLEDLEKDHKYSILMNLKFLKDKWDKIHKNSLKG